MTKPSMMTMGGRMTYELDEARGRALGCVIKLGGSIAGFRLSVEEVVTVGATLALRVRRVTEDAERHFRSATSAALSVA